MSAFTRLLAVMAVVAACVAISAHAAVIITTNTALAGVTDYRLSNNAANPYPTTVSVTGEREGSSYINPTLSGGVFTIQGASAMYTSTSAPAASISVTAMKVTNGNVVINGYFPRVTNILFSGMSGQAPANTPMIDMSAMVSGYQLVVEVVDSTVSWAATETTANTQVLMSMPSTLSGTTGVFVLGIGLTRASAVMSIPSSSTSSSLQVTTNSIIAVDYVTCTNCENGVIYTPSFPMYVLTNSLVRVSHITLSSATAVTLLNTGANTVQLDASARFVVENITAPTATIFSSSASVSAATGSVVLRYLDLSAIGTTLGSGTSYTDVSVKSGSDALAGASEVVGKCPAACLNGFALADAALSCNCTCTSATVTSGYYENFCTVVTDPLADYHVTGCMDGCTWCHNESACNLCGTGYVLNTATSVCEQTPTTCPTNCATCSSAGICTACNDGYALTSSNACVRCSVPNCKQCSATNPGVCSLCSDDAVPVNNVCVLSCTDPNCASCPTAPGTCARCADHYGLVNGVCTACTDPNCRQCNGDVNNCTTCEDGWFATTSGTCSSSSGSCDVADCLECDSNDPTRCIKCIPGKTVDTHTGQCIVSGDCHVTNCLTCSATSAYLCETCNDGYVLSSDKTTCSLTTTSTTTTTTTTSTTGSPSSAPTPTPTATSLCNVPNCVTCVTGDASTCQYCSPGYYTSNGQCVLTGSCYAGNCAQCMLRDSSKCSTCRNGYLLSSTYTCLSQHVVSGAAAPHSLWLAAAVLLASALTYLA